MNLAGKKAIVTGANRSIGRAIALDLARRGVDVVISYRSDETGARETVRQLQELNSKATCFYADFTEPRQVEEFAAKALEFAGGVDILINNAGMLSREKFFEIKPEKLLEVMQVNAVAPFHLMQLCVRQMLTKNTGGCVINISSIAGIATFPRGPAYAASKAALNKLTRNSALELAKFGIRVNAVAPGVVASGMNETTSETDPETWKAYQEKIPLGTGIAENISNMVLFLVSDEACWITGKVFEVDGGHII